MPGTSLSGELVRDVYQQECTSLCLVEAVQGYGPRIAQMALLVGYGAGICFGPALV